MKPIAILSSLILFFSCAEKSNNDKLAVKEYSINPNSFIELKKEINYTNRFEFIIVNGQRMLFNLSKTGTILIFNLDKGTVKKIEANIAGTEFDAVRYELNNCQFINQNILYNFNYKSKSLDTIANVPFDKNEFIIHNLYSQNIFKNHPYYYIQYGDENGYNRLSKFGLLFFNKDTNFRFIKTPVELKQNYIHYNDMCVDNIDNTYFYTYATTSLLHKINIATKRDTFSSLNSKFVLFDTTKLNDMKYIYDYTYATTYNVKLLCSKKNVYVVQRFQKNNNTNFKLYQYDKDLNIKAEFVLRHSVDPNFIFLVGNKLDFISFKDKKIYEYEVD